ncbi:MAG: hypothetical protein JRJ44_07260 [Deltaproteobacteria bacterium]|nr:hypothetical protein [Deltaproteobacteria bacterium]
MKQPYEMTNKILGIVASISEKIGEINAAHLSKPVTKLRKKNRIKTIQFSLEIEQITDSLNNKKVLTPKKDIIEVKKPIGYKKE